MIMSLEEEDPIENKELLKLIFHKVASEHSSDDHNRIMADTLY
jgi:hypothetical protein